jgi:hypothetical protein
MRTEGELSWIGLDRADIQITSGRKTEHVGMLSFGGSECTGSRYTRPDL